MVVVAEDVDVVVASAEVETLVVGCLFDFCYRVVDVYFHLYVDLYHLLYDDDPYVTSYVLSRYDQTPPISTCLPQTAPVCQGSHYGSLLSSVTTILLLMAYD